MITIGYGYKRAVKEFAKHKCDYLYLDTVATTRSEFREMLEYIDDEPDRGSITLVLISTDDLGGRHHRVNRFRRLAESGIRIETCQASTYTGMNPRKPKNTKSRLKWTMSGEEESELRAMWTNDLVANYEIGERAAVMTGQDPADLMVRTKMLGWLTRRFGLRKSTPTTLRRRPRNE